MNPPLIPLSELGEIVSGSTPRTANKEFWNGDIPWITPADLTNHNGVWFRGRPKHITKAGFDSCSTRMLPRGSILFSSRAPIGHCALAPYPVCTNQGFKNLIPNTRLDPLYGYFALRFATPSIIARGRGATFAEVTKEIMEAVRIPVPDILEQQRIATLLENVDRLRRTRQYALDLGRTFPQGLFLKIFGDPFENAKQWPMTRLRGLASKFSDGPFGSNLKTSHYKNKGVRVIRLQNIGIGQFIDRDKVYISEAHFSTISKHECLPGDVLIGTLGDPNLRACVLPETISIALNKADCIQARIDPEKADPWYVCWLLNMPSTLYLTPGMVHGQTRDRISMGQLAELNVPLPPLQLQRQFVKILRRYETLRHRQRENERQAEHLFETLLHRAFDRSDE